MEKTILEKEKRSERRFKLDHYLEIQGDDFKLQSQIKDISCGGMFCQIDRFIPLKTKLSIKMDIPLVINRKMVEKKFTCIAEVARINPPTQQEEGLYNVGISFSDVSEDDRAVILKFVRQKNLNEAKELKGMFRNLKKMVDELMMLEEAHPTAENFRNVLNRAIEELEAVANILDLEIDELKNLI